MLEGCTRLAGGDGTHEGVEILAAKRGESRRVLLVADVGQQLARRAAMVGDGRRREPPDLLQVGPVDGDSLLNAGQRARRT